MKVFLAFGRKISILISCNLFSNIRLWFLSVNRCLFIAYQFYQSIAVSLLLISLVSQSLFLSPDPNQIRWQVKFTIRDAPSDYINVCCWGGDTFINDISRLYKIGDVGQQYYQIIICPPNFPFFLKIDSFFQVMSSPFSSSLLASFCIFQKKILGR